MVPPYAPKQFDMIWSQKNLHNINLNKYERTKTKLSKPFSSQIEETQKIIILSSHIYQIWKVITLEFRCRSFYIQPTSSQIHTYIWTRCVRAYSDQRRNKKATITRSQQIVWSQLRDQWINKLSQSSLPMPTMKSPHPGQYPLPYMR